VTIDLEEIKFLEAYTKELAILIKYDGVTKPIVGMVHA